MANRLLNQFRYSFEPQVVEIFAVVTIGASGAPTLSRGKGISSITRNSAGQYTILLQDVYQQLLDCSVSIDSGTSAAAAPMWVVEDETVSSTKNVILQFRAIDNSTVTDPADGEILRIRMSMRNSSI
jgi:hypothetical protein